VLLENTEIIRAKRSQKNIPDDVISLRYGSAMRRTVTDTASRTILIQTNAEKYSRGSFPSDILLTAAPPNPPSPIRLKIPK
jgi:hypothetical protein